MQTSHLILPEPLKTIETNGERIVAAVFHGENRFPEYLNYQRRVFAHQETPINHVATDFSCCLPGPAIDEFLTAIDDRYDYLILFDVDAVPLRSDFVATAVDKIRDKRTVFGAAQQSNHLLVNGTFNHVYAGPCAFAISRELYHLLGRPTFAETSRSDCAEEITWHAEERGFNVCVMFPSHVHEKRWQLGNGHQFGIGTTYADSVFHAFVPTEERSKRLFVETCEGILARPIDRRVLRTPGAG